MPAESTPERLPDVGPLHWPDLAESRKSLGGFYSHHGRLERLLWRWYWLARDRRAQREANRVTIPEGAYAYYICERQLCRAPAGFVSQCAIFTSRERGFWVDPEINVFTDCQPIDRERALKIAGVEHFPDGPDPTDPRLLAEEHR